MAVVTWIRTGFGKICRVGARGGGNNDPANSALPVKFAGCAPGRVQQAEATDMNKAALIAAIEQNIKNERPWGEAISAFVLDRDFPAINALLRARHDLIGDAVSFALRFVVTVIVEGERMAAAPGVCRWLLDSVAADSAFRGFFEFGAGMEAGLAFRLDEASTLLRAGAHRMVVSCNEVFAGDPGYHGMIGRMMRDANLIEPACYDLDGGAGDNRPLPELTVLATGRDAAGPASDNGLPLVVAACDWAYFRLYHQRFLARLAAVLPEPACLIHLINPEAGTGPMLEALCETYPWLRVTGEAGPSYKVYYASSRFLIAERLMDRFGRDVVTVDLDGVFNPDFPMILARTQGLDVAYLQVSSEASLVCRIAAAFLFIRNSAAGRRFLHRNSAYLIRKLAQDPIWMIDQAALFRSVCLSRGDSGRIADLGVRLERGFDLRASLVEAHIMPEESRRSGRAPFGVCPVTFTAALKPVYQTPYSVWGG
jgi:hypothetical protein